MNMIEKPKELISKEEIKKRVQLLGKQITEDFKGKNLSIICVMKGCIPFAADLIRNIPIPFKLEIIQASSYINTESTGSVHLFLEPVLTKGESVLIIDDILDTGRTITKIIKRFQKYSLGEIKVCVLLDKPSSRIEPIHADYVGFEIPNAFVVGYGLDYNEYYRNLPYIGTLESEKTNKINKN